MKKITREEIEKRAHQTLIEHGMLSIPVDPVVIANRMGIRVSNAVFSDAYLSGMVAKRGDKKSVLVNNNDSLVRKRFTIAHELGHCILHLQNEGEFIDSTKDLFRSEDDSSHDDYREVEANEFAAAILMDADMIRETWSKYRDAGDMAQLFRVSEAAMSVRLKTLGLMR